MLYYPYAFFGWTSEEWTHFLAYRICIHLMVRVGMGSQDWCEFLFAGY